MMETTRNPIPPALRMMVLARDNFTCRYCGRRAPFVELHIDHRRPVSRGGNDMPSNLITACSDCNLGKSNTYYVPPRLRILDIVWRFLCKRIVLIDDVDYRLFRAFQAGQLKTTETNRDDLWSEIEIDAESETPSEADVDSNFEEEGDYNRRSWPTRSHIVNVALFVSAWIFISKILIPIIPW